MCKTYDLIVLGGGPAGVIGAATAAAFRKSVAIVEAQSKLGGAGINTGTVPSKTLRETALTLSGARSRKLYGIDLSLRRDATVADFLRHARAVRTSLNDMLSQEFAASGADVYIGIGEFEDCHTIRVLPAGAEKGGESRDAKTVERIRGSHILIATGSSPFRPDIFPFGDYGVYDSDTILDLQKVPKKMAVVGAGTIGCEYACIFAALGAKVHVVDGRSGVLPFLDTEIAGALTTAMESNGINFHWGERVQGCKEGPSDGVVLTLASGTSIHADAAMIAAGRKSNVERLNLAAAGLATAKRGLIAVDDQFRTQVDHIYAAGDVIGPPALASTGMEQARRAMRHAFSGTAVCNIAPLLPTGVYTIPEIGMAGETEDELKRKGEPYVAGRAFYDRNARGKIIGDSEGMLKLLFRQVDLKLIGVHVIGEQATELVHLGLIAMLCGASAALFDEACFNIPTLGHLFKVAALDALRRQK